MSAAAQICERLRSFRDAHTKLAHDIEGYANTGVSVCSFAWSAHEALSIPLRHLNWVPWWSADEEAAIMAALKAVLEDPLVPKVAHNWAFEMFVWRWHDGIQVRGIVDDTMLKMHTIYPELEKALDVVASIYSLEPYWKDMSDTDDDEVLARYNALDSLVTYEVNEAMECELTMEGRRYYQHQLALLAPCHEMAFEGMAYDAVARDHMVAAIQQEVLAYQGELDSLAGIGPPTFEEVARAVAFKNKLAQCKDWPDLLLHAKPTMREPLTGAY